mmetsp:Transcript_40875/g.161917  ORF Transcript_40875/g.161917 Transcript_40875/m.161917 type:complete len:172 (+) Transcript_40875:704-1219(+)
MGKYSKDQAELSGRTQANLTDVLASLERAAVTTQTNIRELAMYCMSEEVAFPKALTGFPPEPRVVKGTKDALIEIPLEKENGQDGPAPKKKGEGPHMESWMPQLPPAYTYVSTVEQRNALKDGVSEQTVSKQRRQVWDARAFTCRILLFLRDILNPVARIFRFRPKKSLWS